MNYIHKLQQQVKELEDEKTDAREVLQELVDYLNSDKFRCNDSLDGYVNIKDVLTRLTPARSVLMDGPI